MKEIGSEFHYEWNEQAATSGVFFSIDGHFTFSGRTAIETVLLNEPDIQTALLPSYCCESMIEPFRRAGIKVSFYRVAYDGRLTIELRQDADCILWCNYFGFNTPMPDLSEFIKHGGIVIEDITHSMFSSLQFHKQSHYLVASLRKWEPILCGGYCASRIGKLNYFPELIPDASFIEQKKTAMILKNQYLSGDIGIKKAEFLQLFSNSNEWLAANYSQLAIDPYSKDYLLHTEFESHRKQRVINATTLYEELRESKTVSFLFPIEDMDCPLFVPIIIQGNKRDFIRKELIRNDVYCPVHWPHPNDNCESNLYNLELSLVCDQRYTVNDMMRVVKVLNEIK